MSQLSLLCCERRMLRTQRTASSGSVKSPLAASFLSSWLIAAFPLPGNPRGSFPIPPRRTSVIYIRVARNSDIFPHQFILFLIMRNGAGNRPASADDEALDWAKRHDIHHALAEAYALYAIVSPALSTCAPITEFRDRFLLPFLFISCAARVFTSETCSSPGLP